MKQATTKESDWMRLLREVKGSFETGEVEEVMSYVRRLGDLPENGLRGQIIEVETHKDILIRARETYHATIRSWRSAAENLLTAALNGWDRKDVQEALFGER